MPKKETVVQRKRAAAQAARSKKTTAPRRPRSTSATAATTVRQQAPAKAKAAPVPKLPSAQVCADHQRRTALVLERDLDRVKYVALDIENGLDLTIADPQQFDDRFHALVDYPVEKAAALYVEYARGLGATEQVMRMLGKLTNVTNEDIEMAAKKKTARAAAPVKTEKKASKKSAATKTAAAPKPKKDASEKKERKPRGPTAAGMFQELLMTEGTKKGVCKFTDDQIFDKVKKEFGLGDDKRSYVKWYRNYLTKQGKNPPAAIE